MSKKPNHQRDRWCRRAAVFALPEYSAGRRTLRYTLRLLGQGVDHEDVGRDHRNVLLAVGALIGERIGVTATVEPGLPERLAALRFVRAEAVVVGRGDEQHAAPGHDGAGQRG